jgi:diaminohydroxyphosphoribosylaminopyrimidine deaminase / 5-amino-6-(5-phosphoribosylamino)uracil reductase
MNFTAADAQFMARALELARRGLYTTDPNPRVGCVIVKDDQIVGEGFHERVGGPHAEPLALKQAGQQARGATVYVTLEPCCHHGRTPPCTEALLAAGVGRVVAAMKDSNPKVAGNGFAALEAKGVITGVGLMQDQAKALNPGFISRMERGQPFVRVKLASSLDGRTALASGESKWISGEAARADVQRWRARSSAILTGIGTVLADDPRLTVRDLDIGRAPLRVVVDSKLRMPPTAQLLRQPGRTLVVGATDDQKRADTLRAAGAEVLLIPGSDAKVDLDALMRELAAREVSEVLVEAGATLCGALLKAGLAQELLVYYAPCLLGSEERGMFQLPPLARMNDRLSLEITDIRAIGRDWRVIATVAGR